LSGGALTKINQKSHQTVKIDKGIAEKRSFLFFVSVKYDNQNRHYAILLQEEK
jgi:hypothetical protein